MVFGLFGLRVREFGVRELRASPESSQTPVCLAISLSPKSKL